MKPQEIAGEMLGKIKEVTEAAQKLDDKVRTLTYICWIWNDKFEELFAFFQVKEMEEQREKMNAECEALKKEKVELQELLAAQVENILKLDKN